MFPRRRHPKTEGAAVPAPNRGAKEKSPIDQNNVPTKVQAGRYVPPYQRGPDLKILAITDVRKYFAAVVDSVSDDAEECVIPEEAAKAVVIVSLTSGTR